MINTIFNNKYQYKCILILMMLAFSGFRSQPKSNTDIVLQDERLPFSPKEFYIANVQDERENRTAVASLLPAVIIKNNEIKTSLVDLHGGPVAAISQFISHNLPVNKSLRPIVLGLRKFSVTESIGADGLVEGHVSLVISFSLDRGEDEAVHLADYNGKATYTRSAGPPQDIEPTLRKLLVNGLVYINTWMNQQAGTNVKLAKAVKVTFTDHEEKREGDTVYYSANRPLTWNDFQSKTGNNKYEAEIFPTIGYDEIAKVINGVVNVHLIIKVSIPKSACWVKEGSQSAYALNHEQRHFDIAKLAAEHFVQKIKAENLPVSNFEGIINVDYLDAYREMNTLQKLYDNETMHGVNQSEQQRWNERIDKELAAGLR